MSTETSSTGRHSMPLPINIPKDPETLNSMHDKFERCLQRVASMEGEAHRLREGGREQRETIKAMMQHVAEASSLDQVSPQRDDEGTSLINIEAKNETATKANRFDMDLVVCLKEGMKKLKVHNKWL